MVQLAHGFIDAGLSVDLVLPQISGPYRDRVRPDVRVIDLGCRRVLTSLPALCRYLRRERPAALLATLSHANVIALWAHRLAQVPTRIVLREANTLSVATRWGTRLRDRALPWLARHCYHWADEIVAVSEGVAGDLVNVVGVPRHRVHVLYNPIVTPELMAQAAEPVDHPWFRENSAPVILGVGRLARQKDFPTLIRAFGLVRARRPVRLAILGEGEDRLVLERLTAELRLADDVWMPGFVPNPFKYMARASAFVLSSVFEGSPGALVQAMACGAPTIATDCLSGPREILEGGCWGKLVPVGDAAALAAAIEATLDGERRKVPPEAWARFTPEVAVAGYLRLLGAEPDA